MEQIIQEAGLDLHQPTEEALSRTGSLLKAAGKKGIWLAAPSPIGIDSALDIDITGFDVFGTREREGRYFRKTAVIVGTRVESRETFAELLFEPKEKRPKRPNPPAAQEQDQDDDDPPPNLEMVSRFSVALRSRLKQMPWRTGTYLVDVLFDDDVSNRAQFELTAGKAASKDPAVAAFIEAQKTATGEPKEIYPADGNYEKTDKSLEIPAAEGIAIAAERVAVYRPDEKNILRGSYRLPVPAAFYAGETATVPITLVITGNLKAGAFVVPLLIPTKDKVTAGEAVSTVTGVFEIDLFAIDRVPKVPQTYTIRAYSGAVRSEPLKAAFITPEMLK
ncbi:MAG TPA: hypothetical protein VFQ91_27470 [Bryobacteraceae bacterium]|nr:hypothetical protein [Bryobacteraceae bacterium]